MPSKPKVKLRHPVCPFCRKRDAAPSGEDIFARWIARLIAGERKGRFGVVGGMPGQEPNERWGAKGKIGFLVNAPCEHCNNRWMSTLETKAKPILEPLIEGHRCVVTTDQQVTIARWMTKTVMNWEYFRRRNPRYFTAAERFALCERLKVPDHTMFFIGHYRGEVTKAGTEIHESMGLMNDYDLPLDVSVEGKTYKSSAYVVTFAIGLLAIQMFSHRWTKTRSTFTLKGPPWNDAAIRIWPGVVRNVEWPPPAYMDHDGMTLFANRWRQLIPSN